LRFVRTKRNECEVSPWRFERTASEGAGNSSELVSHLHYQKKRRRGGAKHTSTSRNKTRQRHGICWTYTNIGKGIPKSSIRDGEQLRPVLRCSVGKRM